MRPTRRLLQPFFLLFVLTVLALLTAAPAAADQVVYFKSGRVIVASGAEERGGWVFMEFVGGGILGVPGATIDRIEESDLAREETASFGNTIQAPDASRRTSRSTGPTGRPFQPEAGVDPGNGNNQRGNARGNRGGAINRPGRTPGRGGPQTPQLQQNPGAPFGLQPIDLSGNQNQNRAEEEEE